MGLQKISSEGTTAQFSGASPWATYWIETMRELAPALEHSGNLTAEIARGFFAHYHDPHYWTSVITFTATWGRKPKP